MNIKSQLKYLILYGIILVNSSLLYSNDQEIKLIPLLRNKLPVEGQNWAIAQDDNTAMLYFANSRGLIVYDGINTSVHELPLSVPVRSVNVNNDIVYTGAYEEFGYWQRNDSCRLKYFSLSSGINMAPNDEIWKIYKRWGKVYFQSFTSIYEYDAKNVKRFEAPHTMLFMFPVSKGFIVQVLHQGLFLFDGNNFSFVEGSDLFTSTKVHGIIPINDGMLVCTESKGIYKYEKNKFITWKAPVSEFLQENSCNNALTVNDSTYIFGTILKGIVISDKEGNIIQNISAINGLNNNTVLSLLKGHNNIWVGLDNGVNYFNPNNQSTYYADITGNLGTIYGMIKDDSNLYIGTNHGLYVTQLVKNSMIPSFEKIKHIPGSTGQVWYLKEIDDVLFCGHNDGTFIVQNDELKKVSDFTGGWNIQEYGSKLISGSYTGIVIFEKLEGKWHGSHKIAGFHEPTRHLVVDYMGYIWTSHPRKGIYKIEPGRNLDTIKNIQYLEQINGKSRKVDVFKINNQIVFSTGIGFYTYDYINDKLVPLEALNSSIGKYKKSLQVTHLETNRYLFYTSTETAIIEISIDMEAKIIGEIQQEITFLPERDIPVVEMGKNHWLLPNRQGIYFSRLPTAGMYSRNTLFIDKIIALGKKNHFIFCNESAKFTFPHAVNGVEIHFGDMSMMSNKTEFHVYRIKQINEYWHPTSPGKISILNLKHGFYQVEIKNLNTGNLKKLAFHINKPWYISMYAVVFYAFVLLIFIYLFNLYFQHRIRKHRQHVANEINIKKLSRELDFKSYELTLTIRYLIKKNEILTDLKDEVNEVKNKSSRSAPKSFNKIDRIIKKGLETQTRDWKHALDNLKLSQQEFFKRLKEKYPELTPYDLRLCSYLRMNFMTKEIAQLLNISTRGVEISRYRLRKKLRLKKEQSLSEFLIKEEF